MNYLSWHYLYAPKRLPDIWRNFLLFIIHFFSLKELPRHLFAPWKRQTIEKGPGLNLEEIISVLSFNLISRLIGAFVRLFLMSLGLTALIILACAFPLALILWFLLPGLTYPLFKSLKKHLEIPDKIILADKISPPEILKEFLNTSQGKFFLSRLSLDLIPLTLLPATETITSLNIRLPSDLSALASASAEALAKEGGTFYNWSSLISFLAENWSPFTQILKEKSLYKKDTQNVLNWYEDREKERQQNWRFWWKENLLRVKPLGRDFVYGYTIDLDKFSTDLSAPLPYSHHLVGRQKEARMIEQVLARASENNVILIGEPGVGRTTIVLNFARMVSEGRVDPILTRKRVLELNLNLILAQAKNLQEIKGLTESILKQANDAGNIILVVKQIDLYLANAEGRINLTDVFTKWAASSSLQIIGITTPADFQKYLFPNQEVNKYFEKVEVTAPTAEEAYLILQKVAPVFEQRSKTFITYQAIKETIQKSDQYLTDLPFPEKAIDLLDEVCVNVASSHNTSKVLYLNELRIIDKEDVDQILSEKTKIPVGEIKKEEKEKLINLEKVLHQRIIDQEEAIKSLAKAMRRARTGISTKNRPIGTFLFLGPTGVGKTETAKALAAAYFGSEERMIRFDIGEYQSEDALDKAIGSLNSREPGLFSKSIRENPFALLLLDEIEKANPKFLNLLLTLLDEGYFTDSFGRRVDCRNLIIIATSNAGAEFIRQKVSQTIQNTSDLPADEAGVEEFAEGEGTPRRWNRLAENFPKEVTEYILRQGIFSPEFINRFDAVVVFKPLTSEHLEKIAQLLLENLNKRLAEKECSLKITPELIKKVAELGYEPAFGARPMRRIIQDKIEDQIAQKLLKGEVKKDQEIEIKI